MSVARSSTRRIALAFGAGALALSLSAGTVLAGEITGNGKSTPIRTYLMSSICAFSGYNDDPEIEPGRTAAHVQSWGQIPKADRDFLSTIGLHPGDACNGHTGELAGGGGEE
jgi:hypothetical protein